MKSLSLSQPHAIIMVGIAGSGKSTFAAKFAETFNAPFVDIYQILTSAKDPAAADDILIAQLEELTKTKATLIIDADASTRTRRTELGKFFRSRGYEPLFVWVQTDQETARHRTRKLKKISHQDFEALIKHFSPPHESEKALVVSGKHTFASQIKIVLRRISTERASIQATQRPTMSSSRSGRITIQ